MGRGQQLGVRLLVAYESKHSVINQPYPTCRRGPNNIDRLEGTKLCVPACLPELWALWFWLSFTMQLSVAFGFRSNRSKECLSAARTYNLIPFPNAIDSCVAVCVVPYMHTRTGRKGVPFIIIICHSCGPCRTYAVGVLKMGIVTVHRAHRLTFDRQSNLSTGSN